MTPESKSRVLYENLDTTFVNLWALLRSLSQRGFIGRVHVEMKDYTADVFITGSNTPLVREIDRAAGSDVVGEGGLHRLVLRVRETPGTISVFEGADEVFAVRGDENSETETSQPGALDEDEKLQLSSGVNQGTPANEDPDAIAMTNVAGPPIETLAKPPASGTQPMDEIEWEAIVRAGAELIGSVERAVTDAGADFNALFNAARLALADDYTFLDPMSDGFSYAKSIVNLSDEIPVNDYVAGLSEALRRVVDRVAAGDRARRLRERVALELLSVARKREEILARSGFRSQLDRIAGTKVI